MMDIERFHLTYDDRSGFAEMDSRANGEYVLHDDYLKQLAECERERDEAVELLKSAFGGYSPPMNVQAFLSTLENENGD